MKKIYLAIPYTGMEESSFEQSLKIASEFINKGYNVFSPIIHSHPIAQKYKLSGSWDFWRNIDFQFIDWCDEVYVIVPNNGAEMVEKSKGVQDEIKYAKENNKKVTFLI